MSRRAERTWSGFWPDQARSALQKAIRRGELDNALYWAVELHLSGEDWYLWRTLVVITSEDASAWPEGPATVRALYEGWRMTGSEDCWADAVIRLARAPKSRIADDALAAHLMGHEYELKRSVPDEALDLHTVRGRLMGRHEDSVEGRQHWFEQASVLAGEVDDPDARHYRSLVEKLWEQGRTFPEPWKTPADAKPPEARGKKPYDLPLGVERQGDKVRVPGTEPGTIWVVDLKRNVCSCPAFARYPGECKHLLAVKALVQGGP